VIIPPPIEFYRQFIEDLGVKRLEAVIRDLKPDGDEETFVF
jgi:hypothetical protein